MNHDAAYTMLLIAGGLALLAVVPALLAALAHSSKTFFEECLEILDQMEDET